jgi:hypothetical protein
MMIGLVCGVVTTRIFHSFFKWSVPIYYVLITLKTRPFDLCPFFWNNLQQIISQLSALFAELYVRVYHRMLSRGF